MSWHSWNYTEYFELGKLYDCTVYKMLKDGEWMNFLHIKQHYVTLSATHCFEKRLTPNPNYAYK